MKTCDPSACKHCGSTRMEPLDRFMNHDRFKCQCCGHIHIEETLYHDHYCCDRVYWGKGGVEGSTTKSRKLHAAAVADRDDAQ